jgi:protein gp37
VGENTKIEWAHHTFNPWIGCTKVGPPCDHCYAETLATRYGWVEWGGERKRTSAANWKKPLQWAKVARASGERPRVFCASLADWLDNQVPQQWREDLGDLIRQTPELDWLLLTKRIQNYERLAPWPVAPRNVWLGITCGDDGEYQRDWWKLSRIPAIVRFISYEPALGPLHPGLEPDGYPPDWIIAGGESGPKARPPHPDWFRHLRDDCEKLGIAVLFKQWGEWRPSGGWIDGQLEHGTHGVSKSGKVAKAGDLMTGKIGGEEWRDWAIIRRVGKKAAGRLLDGREHNGFPEVRAP